MEEGVYNIKNLKNEASRKHYDSSHDSSREYSNSSLSSDSDCDEYRHPDEGRKINRLNNILTDNIKTNKYQHNDVIDNELKFDNNSFNLSSGTRYPLPVVTVSIKMVINTDQRLLLL